MFGIATGNIVTYRNYGYSRRGGSILQLYCMSCDRPSYVKCQKHYTRRRMWRVWIRGEWRQIDSSLLLLLLSLWSGCWCGSAEGRGRSRVEDRPGRLRPSAVHARGTYQRRLIGIFYIGHAPFSPWLSVCLSLFMSVCVYVCALCCDTNFPENCRKLQFLEFMVTISA